jgi:hypothetical protein
VGAYTGQLHEVRWGYYRGWLHGQVRRALVRKRWFQVVVHTAGQLWLVRIQDNGTLGTGRIVGLDRAKGRVIASLMGHGAPLRTLVTGFMAGEGTDSFLTAGRADVRLTRPVGGTSWTLRATWEGITLDWELDTRHAPPCSLVVGEAAPPLAHRPGLTQQAVGLAVRGTTHVNGAAQSMDGAWGQVTYTNAFLPPVVSARLLSAHGTLTDGRRFALCLSDGDLLGETQEQSLFVDGQVLALPRVHLLDGAPWRAESSDGSVSLTATPTARHAASESRQGGWVHHHNTWEAATLTGTLPIGTIAESQALVERVRLQR